MFTDRWTRKRFSIWIALCLTIFIALSIAFPFVLLFLAGASRCSTVPGACGATGLVLSMMMKPTIYSVFLFCLIPPLAGRLRDIGVTPWLSLVVLLLVAADSAFLVFVGAPWSFAFSGGAIGINPPIFFLTALALMIVLAIVPPRDGRIALRSLGWPGLILLVIAIPVCIAAVFRLIWSVPGLLALVIGALGPIRPVINAGIFALIPLPPIAAFALWPRAGQVTVQGPTNRPGIPLVRLGLVALVLASILTLALAPRGVGPLWVLMLPASAATYVLPNALLFFMILLAIYFWVKRPWWAAALSVILLGIYGTWGYQRYLAANSEAMDARDIAAVPVTKPATTPRAIFLDVPGGGISSNFLRLALERSDFDTVLVKEQGKFVGYRYKSGDELVPDPRTHVFTPIERYAVDALPDPRLVLRSWSSSQFYSRAYGGQYEGSSPYELHLVDGTTDQLISVWYRRLIQAPFWLPILTDQGWYAPGGFRAHVDAETAERQFLVAALGQVPLVPRPTPPPSQPTPPTRPTGSGGGGPTVRDQNAGTLSNTTAVVAPHAPSGPQAIDDHYDSGRY